MGQGQVQGKGKAAPLPRPALHAELPAHQLGESPADGQPQTCAGRSAACVARLLEGLEDARTIGFGDARSGVADLEAQQGLAGW